MTTTTFLFAVLAILGVAITLVLLLPVFKRTKYFIIDLYNDEGDNPVSLSNDDLNAIIDVYISRYKLDKDDVFNKNFIVYVRKNIFHDNLSDETILFMIGGTFFEIANELDKNK